MPKTRILNIDYVPSIFQQAIILARAHTLSLSPQFLKQAKLKLIIWAQLELKLEFEPILRLVWDKLIQAQTQLHLYHVIIDSIIGFYPWHSWQNPTNPYINIDCNISSFVLSDLSSSFISSWYHKKKTSQILSIPNLPTTICEINKPTEVISLNHTHLALFLLPPITTNPMLHCSQASR